MDELDLVEEGVNADLFEEYLCTRGCGLLQEVQWLAAHPELASEFTALGAVCDRLESVLCSPAQIQRHIDGVRDRHQPVILCSSEYVSNADLHASAVQTKEESLQPI